MEILDLLNSNDYKRGYDDGYSSGSLGRNKNYVKSGKSLKFFIHGNNALNTYIEGYNEGYRKGCEDRNSKKVSQSVQVSNDNIKNNNSTNNLKSTTMPSIQQYQLQLEKLEELVAFLNSFKEEMNRQMSIYCQKVQIMYESGLPEETTRVFELVHIAETQGYVNQIISLIDDRSLPFTYQNIDLMRHLIELNRE